MKAAVMILALALLGSAAQAKTLNVSCEDREGRTVELKTEIVNVSQPQQIQSFTINGSEVEKYKDVSGSPIYNQGAIAIRINIGYNSVALDMKNCEDSFLAQASGVLKRYVGGFAGTSESELKCSCDLK